MQRDAGHKLADAVVECDAVGEQLAHHRDDVVFFIGEAQLLVAHAAAGAVMHLLVLQVVAGAREQVDIAAMVVVHVADDDVLDLVGVDAEALQRLADRRDDGAAAPRADRLVETGVDHEGALVVEDHPDEVVERLQHVVRIAADVVLRGLALMLGVADRENLPDVVAHVRLAQAFFAARILTPARCSTVLASSVKSDCSPCSFMAASHMLPTAFATSSGMPESSASARNSRTSFTISAM